MKNPDSSVKILLTEIMEKLVLENKFKIVVSLFGATDRSQGGASFWIIYVISVLFCYAFMHICLLMPCGHLLGKG